MAEIKERRYDGVNLENGVKVIIAERVFKPTAIQSLSLGICSGVYVDQQVELLYPNGKKYIIYPFGIYKYGKDSTDYLERNDYCELKKASDFDKINCIPLNSREFHTINDGKYLMFNVLNGKGETRKKTVALWAFTEDGPINLNIGDRVSNLLVVLMDSIMFFINFCIEHKVTYGSDLFDVISKFVNEGCVDIKAYIENRGQAETIPQNDILRILQIGIGIIAEQLEKQKENLPRYQTNNEYWKTKELLSKNTRFTAILNNIYDYITYLLNDPEISKSKDYMNEVLNQFVIDCFSMQNIDLVHTVPKINMGRAK